MLGGVCNRVPSPRVTRCIKCRLMKRGDCTESDGHAGTEGAVAAWSDTASFLESRIGRKKSKAWFTDGQLLRLAWVKRDVGYSTTKSSAQGGWTR
eukprot:SAG31_NODE_675_length_12908_cov_11.596612_1_plen_95_part_00